MDKKVKSLKDLPVTSLINILKEIEETIRHLTKIYASSRITKSKKTFIEKTIRESETRSMAILTILRNRKDWQNAK